MEPLTRTRNVKGSGEVHRHNCTVQAGSCSVGNSICLRAAVGEGKQMVCLNSAEDWFAATTRERQSLMGSRGGSAAIGWRALAGPGVPVLRGRPASGGGGGAVNGELAGGVRRRQGNSGGCPR
jgi:hypothetical protein